jgi:hypothetical protein
MARTQVRTRMIELHAEVAARVGQHGRPHVDSRRPHTIHLWAFDLLDLNGQDCPQPLVANRERWRLFNQR